MDTRSKLLASYQFYGDSVLYPFNWNISLIQQATYNPLTTVPITGWIVQYKLSGGSNDPQELTTVNITDATTLSFVISNLTAGMEYCARVAADTEMGLGPLTEYHKTSTRYIREFLFVLPCNMHMYYCAFCSFWGDFKELHDYI